MAYAATPTVMIRSGRIANGHLAAVPVASVDPCQGVAVGDPCTNGVLYGGTGFAALGSSWKYMTTPGHCSGYPNNFTGFTPACTGATDNLFYKWAANNANPSACFTPAAGTTPCNVTTGLTSTTAGITNSSTLATSYSDTDAARYCENMTYPAGGYTDWFLPSKDELNLVLYAMKVAGKGNFVAANYWSSTESSATEGWYQELNYGGQADDPKTYVCYVRCVRRY